MLYLPPHYICTSIYEYLAVLIDDMKICDIQIPLAVFLHPYDVKI